VDLRYLTLFCRVVDRHSFSLAADDVHISQPAASLQIRALERELGTKLLDRAGRDVTPTDAGAVLYRYAKDMIELAKRANGEISDLGAFVGGRLTVGSSAGPGEQILPTIISRFRQLHPKVAVSLWVAGTREIIDRVLARELEIGVVGALAHHRELVVEPLARDEIVLVCDAQHPWAQRDDVSLPEVIAEPQIVQQQGSGVRTVVEDNLRARGLRPASFNVVAEMGLNESAKQAVMAGDGVSFLSRLAIRTEIEHGTLVVVPVRDLHIERDFYYVHSRTRILGHTAETFIAFLADQSSSI